MPIKILDRVCMVPACEFFLFISLKHSHRCSALIYNAITIILLSTHFLPSPLVAFFFLNLHSLLCLFLIILSCG